jgi:hypothetical protein
MQRGMQKSCRMLVNMNKIQKTIFTLASIPVLAGLVLAFFPKEESFADEITGLAQEYAMTCEKTEKIETPGIVQKKLLTENVREIPIGKSADFTEGMIKNLNESSFLKGNIAQQEIEAASVLLEASKSCIPESSDCSLQAQTMSNTLSSNLLPSATQLNEHPINKEGEYFIPRFWPLLVYNLQYGTNLDDPTNPVRTPTNAQVTSYLQQCIQIPSWLSVSSLSEYSGRTWDDAAKQICANLTEPYKSQYCLSPFEYYTVAPENSVRKGALEIARERLSTCVTEPYLTEAALRSEEAIQSSLTCREVSALTGFTPIHSFIEEPRFEEEIGVGQKTCYGLEYCIAKETQSEKIRSIFSFPENPLPCADDYYCCDI